MGLPTEPSSSENRGASPALMDEEANRLRTFIERLSASMQTRPPVQDAPPGTLAAVALRLAREGDTLHRLQQRVIEEVSRSGKSLEAEEWEGLEMLLVACAGNLVARAEMLTDLIAQASEHENAIAWLQGEVKHRDQLLSGTRTSNPQTSPPSAHRDETSSDPRRGRRSVIEILRAVRSRSSNRDR